LLQKYDKVNLDTEKEMVRVYDNTTPESIVEFLYNKNIIVTEIKTDKIGLEEYYINLMNEKGAR